MQRARAVQEHTQPQLCPTAVPGEVSTPAAPAHTGLAAHTSFKHRLHSCFPAFAIPAEGVTPSRRCTYPRVTNSSSTLSPGRKPGEHSLHNAAPEQREHRHLPRPQHNANLRDSRLPHTRPAGSLSSLSTAVGQREAEPSTALLAPHRELHALPDATRGRRTHGLVSFPKSISGC